MFRKTLSARHLLLPLGLALATFAGCGGTKKNPVPTGSISGGLFVNAGTVAGRSAKAVVAVSGAIITLTKNSGATGTCTTSTTTVNATTDANGLWTASIKDAGEYYVSNIVATNYSFTALINGLNCGQRSATASLGASASPSGLPTSSASAQWTANANLITADTDTTGSLLVLATVNNSGQTTAPSATGLDVSIGGTTHPSGKTGTAFVGVVKGPGKTIGVVAGGSTGLENPSAQTVEVSGSTTVSFALDRVISALNLTSGSVSSAGTHNLAPTCNLAAVPSASLAASTSATCPASKTITYTLSPSTGVGSVSPAGLYTAPTSVTSAATITVTGTLTSNGAAVTGTTTIALSPCPTATPDATPGGGCGVLKTVTAAVADASPFQHSSQTVALTATCAYDTNGDGSADGTPVACTNSATFFNGSTQLSSAALPLTDAGAASVTARVSAAAGAVTSTAVAVNVQARSLSSISLAASGSTVSYASGSPSPSTVTITPTCAYNTGTNYAESLNCTAIGETLQKTATTGTLNTSTDVYTPPTASPDTDTTVTITYSKSGTSVTASTTVTLSAGPQSCTGETLPCIDLSGPSGADPASATNGQALTLTVTASNLNAVKGGKVVITWNTTDFGSTASNVTANASDWTCLANTATAGRLVCVLDVVSSKLATGITGTSELFTFQLTPSSTGSGKVISITTPSVSDTSLNTSTQDLNTPSLLKVKNGKANVQ